MNAFVFNLAFLVLSFVLAIARRIEFESVKTDFPFFVFVVIGGIIVVNVGCAIQNVVDDRDYIWVEPSLRKRFYFFRQPLQSYYICSLMFGAYAFGLCLKTFLSGSLSQSYLLYFAGALGGYIGVLAATRIFRKRQDSCSFG